MYAAIDQVSGISMTCTPLISITECIVSWNVSTYVIICIAMYVTTICTYVYSKLKKYIYFRAKVSETLSRTIYRSMYVHIRTYPHVYTHHDYINSAYRYTLLINLH